MVAVLEVYLHSKSWTGSRQSSLFPSVFVVRECSQSAKAAPSTVGRKKTQIKKKKHDSVFLFYWFMACGQLADTRISRGPPCSPSPSSGNSTFSRLHTWKQCVDQIGIGTGGNTRKIQLFPPTLVLGATVVELRGRRLIWSPSSSPRTSLGTHVFLERKVETRSKGKRGHPMERLSCEGTRKALRYFSLGTEGSDARARKSCVPDTLIIILVPLPGALTK